jgi:NAD(P)-dependent dehydrogenase (short-subunit alcohol dehydrogenase family)
VISSRIGDDGPVEAAPKARTALVTGAAGGIGTAIVDTMRAAGFEVVTLDREGDVDVVADLAVDSLPTEVTGAVDVCVSNAAIVDTIAPAHRMTAEQWSRDIDANLTGAFRVIQACLPGMRERRWGRIVVISSAAARLGLAGQAAYTASKAGLLGLVRTLAVESLRHGITANAVLPGMVATPKVLSMPEPVRQRVEQWLPMGRMAAPREVAALVAFLCSEEAAYITGQDIGIDGGLGLSRESLGSDRG